MSDYPTARSAWSPPDWPATTADADDLEIWCYTDRFSYLPGEDVALHVHTTAERYSVHVVRDGAQPVTVQSWTGLQGSAHPTPADAYAAGCGWPVSHTFAVPADWTSGLYLVTVRTETRGDEAESDHFFVVRAAEDWRASAAIILTTSTLLAYNDWGGGNHYRGLGEDPAVDVGSARSSMHRPLGRGFLRKPPGAPRSRTEQALAPYGEPRYEVYEWARLRGYSRHHADAFWATFERPFVVWAEEQGYELDYLTQDDLHRTPGVLDGYACAIFVGHDEYWSWEMRDAVDAFVEGGGRVARFAGNFLWQVRLEGSVQVAYKYGAEHDDPQASSEHPERTTVAWDHPITGRPGATTFGLTANAGTYSRYGAAVPRGHGGLQVYRPDHWSLAGTDSYYGDIIGGMPAGVGTYEVDGCDHVVEHGVPRPTGADGAPANLEIIALGPAVKYEEDHFAGTVPLGDPGNANDAAAEGRTWVRTDDGERRPAYGAAMMVAFSRGHGEVFNSGTTEWVAGLIHGDRTVETITRNVLDRFGVERP
jgi:hypothetical protein